MFGEQPYNLFTRKPYKFSHVSSPMLKLKNECGFGSFGFCTKPQAMDHGCKIRYGEATRYAWVEFENGKWAKFYNEEQVECRR